MSFVFFQVKLSEALQREVFVYLEFIIGGMHTLQNLSIGNVSIMIKVLQREVSVTTVGFSAAQRGQLLLKLPLFFDKSWVNVMRFQNSARQTKESALSRYAQPS